MNASELIERLQKLIELHGDLSIGIRIEQDIEYLADAYYVEYDDRFKEFCIH